MSDWDDVGSWTGEGLRREVFYMRSGEADVFVSLWESAEQRATFGFLVCPAWGFEGTTSGGLQTALARTAAEHGGLGIVFHYPGSDDSTGDPEETTVDVMARAAIDCAHAVRHRFSGEWIVAGVRFGASIAALVSTELRAARLLFVDEQVDPEAYFRQLIRRAQRAKLAYAGSGHLAFGVPLSETVIRSAAARTNDVAAALRTVGRPITSIRYRDREADADAAPHIAPIIVDGQARWLSRNDHPLVVAAAGRWLNELSGQNT